jgi:hypothetical protein
LCPLLLFSKVATNIRIAFVEIGVAVRSGWMPRVAVVGVALLGLSGCRIFVKEEPPPCPRVSVLEDASKLVRFRSGSHDAKDIELAAEIVKYRGACYYDNDEKTMKVALTVGIDAFPGPVTAEGPQQAEYFVAIPAFSGNADGKKILPVTLNVSPKEPKGIHFTDGEVSLTFPVKDIKKLEAYEIFVGFQLTQDQLDYNRKHSFR